MLKSELISKLAKKLKLSEFQAKTLLHDVVEMIISGCIEDGVVVIRGFGTFKKCKRKARVGTNPGTGERVKYPESKMVTFKAAKGLKSRLR
jgi:DNA-binding protein HU-beta